MKILPEYVKGKDSEEDILIRDKNCVEEKNNKLFFSPEKGTKAYDFFQKTVNAAQTWFSLFGWPQGPHSFSIPESIRRDVCKMQFYSSSSKRVSRQNDFSRYNKTIYDVILHLSGRLPFGIKSGQALPVESPERLKQLYLQHNSLLSSLISRGAYLSNIRPEFLFEPKDYKNWIEMTVSSDDMPVNSYTSKENNPFIIDLADFEGLSKWAWTEVFLQMYKVPFTLKQIIPSCAVNMPKVCHQSSPKYGPHFGFSNIYSHPENLLLGWMNGNYENTREIVWGNSHLGGIPSKKWITNFDKDLSDGLVLASQIATYCPYWIESHFAYMYTQPKIPDQYRNNSLIVVNVLREIGFNMNIQAEDICDPNPVLMLMLCAYMYERLPTFLPRKVVTFHAALYEIVTRQIMVTNPSKKTLTYNALIVGRDAKYFSLLQTEKIVQVPPNDTQNKDKDDTTKSHSQFQQSLKTSISANFIREFFSSTHSVYLEAKECSKLEIFFLPFDFQTRYCVIILSNQKIGELVYIVEGTGMIPLPSPLIPTTLSHPLDNNSYPEKGHNSEDATMYLNCAYGSTLDTELRLPLTNEAKEEAFIFAAQKQMSELEYKRRMVTGTLESSSIRVAVGILGLTMNESQMLFTASELKKPRTILYKTEMSLPDYFEIPDQVLIPQIPDILDKHHPPNFSEEQDHLTLGLFYKLIMEIVSWLDVA
ncbi:PREDICTED: calponin homology domain-containing protein 2 [Elephantulus edwardii]|uniref:calponin homology domain-containing protein 2 n=1 Tax=Elephantulus edwardii TaxID=28737 RepID=UPI0003F0E8E1|nr:PREDICTED: calponin homology domain-containing protein 2 [Elephantulus edwardii]